MEVKLARDGDFVTEGEAHLSGRSSLPLVLRSGSFEAAGARSTGSSAGSTVGPSTGPSTDWAAGSRKTLSSRPGRRFEDRSEEHTSELQQLMRISYAVF